MKENLRLKQSILNFISNHKKNKLKKNRSFPDLIINSRSFSSKDADLTTVITWRSNSVIYNAFTYDVNINVRRHYLG